MTIVDAAGNFLCPAAGLSFNAFRTVMDIDANGTFNVTKAVFDQFMKVSMDFLECFLEIATIFLNAVNLEMFALQIQFSLI